MPPLLMRRRAAFGAIAAASAVWPAARARAATPAACILTPQSVEGPFYLDPRLHRADLAEGRPGVPLELRLTVIEAGPCTPIPGARVDVWGADAQGIYSGFARQGDDRSLDMTGRTFLRGTQFADAAARHGAATRWAAGRKAAGRRPAPDAQPGAGRDRAWRRTGRAARPLNGPPCAPPPLRQDAPHILGKHPCSCH